MTSDIKSIGLFIDGGYYKKTYDALRKNSHRLNLAKLCEEIQNRIAFKFDPEHTAQFIITEGHYFRGRYKLKDAKDKNLLEVERGFEDELIYNDVVFHYKHIHDLDENRVQEKGIDVWYALETFELAMYRDFDFIVLITGDADHEMLARKLKSLKKQVVLVTWNVADRDSTSPALKAEATFHIDFAALTRETPELLESLCKNKNEN